MHVQGISSAAWVVMATIGLVRTRVLNNPCNKTIVLEKNQHVRLDVSTPMTSLWQAREACTLELSTVEGWRVVVTFDYRPSVAAGSFGVPDDCAYTLDYLLIGNDFTAIGEELMTSYKFCRETLATEIVSRDNYLWVVLESSTDHAAKLHLSAKALPLETCSDGQMRCSPVQCIDNTRVCDGRADCSNGLDEFCYDFANITRLLDVINLDTSEGRQLLPPEDSACFLCRDGTCVLPRVSPYDWRQDVWLWYLCDGVSHCPDAWDEQNYMCYLMKHFPERFQSHLFQCEAFDPPAAVVRQVQMWSLARCDDRRDCREEGVEGEEKCDESLRTQNADGRSQLHVDPVTLSLVIAFAVVVALSALLVIRTMDRRRPVTRDDDAVADALPDNCGDLRQSCVAAKSSTIDTGGLQGVAKNDFEQLGETFV